MSEALLNFAAFYQYYGKLCVHGCCMTNNIRCLSAQDTYVLCYPAPAPFHAPLNQYPRAARIYVFHYVGDNSETYDKEF